MIEQGVQVRRPPFLEDKVPSKYTTQLTVAKEEDTMEIDAGQHLLVEGLLNKLQ